MAQHGGDARVLAGGQSLIPAMRYRLARPAVLVDINRLPDLSYVREADGMLVVGALARDAALERTALIGRSYPLIADTSAVVADPVVRQSGTVVGSLCHSDPAGDWAVTALAMRAHLVVRGGGGARTVPIDEFLVDSFATAVADGELAIEVRFPQPGPRSSGSYQKIERKVHPERRSARERRAAAVHGFERRGQRLAGAARATAQSWFAPPRRRSSWRPAWTRCSPPRAG